MIRDGPACLITTTSLCSRSACRTILFRSATPIDISPQGVSSSVPARSTISPSISSYRLLFPPRTISPQSTLYPAVLLPASLPRTRLGTMNRQASIRSTDTLTVACLITFLILALRSALLILSISRRCFCLAALSQPLATQSFTLTPCFGTRQSRKKSSQTP